MKYNKILIAILVAYTSNTMAQELPFNLKLKYFNKNVETVIYKESGETYIPTDDFESMFGKKPSIQYKTIGKNTYYKASDLGTIELDENEMNAILTLSSQFMPEQRFSLVSDKFNSIPTAMAGYHLDYDYFYSSNTKQHNLFLNNGFTDSKGNFGDFSLYANNDSLKLGVANFNIRNPNKNTLLTLGTSISGKSNINSSVNFLGIQLKSNFDLDKKTSNQASQSFNGTAEVEGTAELFINGGKVLSKDIRPGQFFFDGIYNTSNTAGDVTVIIRDPNGKVVSISKPLVGSPRTLAKGVSEYSIEAGLLRPQQNKFEGLFASGTYLYGLTDNLTIEGHLEASKDAQNISTTLISANSLGTFKAGATIGSGSGLVLGYSNSNQYFNINTEYYLFNKYRNIGSKDVRTQNQFNANLSSNYFGTPLNLNFSKIGNKNALSIGTSFALTQGISLVANLSRTSDKKNTFFIGLNIALDNNRISSSYNSNSKSLTSEFSNTKQELNSPNYIFTNSKSSTSNFLGGSISMPTQYGNFGTEIINSNGKTSMNLKADGSVVYNNGEVILSRRINDSYVIVDTKEGGIDINSSSGYQGKTNSKGLAVFPTTPMIEQKIIIDPKQYDGEKSPSDSEVRYSAFYKSPTKAEIKLIEPGFFVIVDSEKQSININNNQFYKTEKGYYVDGLPNGTHKFRVNGIDYEFNTSDVKDEKVTARKL